MTDPLPVSLRSCPGRCGRYVHLLTTACPRCCDRLPKAVRDEITAAYVVRYKNPRRYRSARLAASRWFYDNPVSVS